jgi:hypothetical protein
METETAKESPSSNDLVTLLRNVLAEAEAQLITTRDRFNRLKEQEKYLAALLESYRLVIKCETERLEKGEAPRSALPDAIDPRQLGGQKTDCKSIGPREQSNSTGGQ